MRQHTGLVLAVLFAGTFVLGCAETLVIGVLDLIATDLGVSIPAAGALVTAGAIGLAVGGPLLTAATIRLNRRTVVLGALATFVLTTTVPLLLPDFRVFVVARVVAGAVQGAFIGAALVAGTTLVPPDRAGRAISVVVSGFAVSTAVGVPLGTLVGQVVGWRGAVGAVVVLAALVLAAATVLVPPVASTPGGATAQARYAFAPRVLAVLAVAVLIFASVSSGLTYLVPFLHGVTGISGSLVSVFLLAYGAATAVGSFGGGRFADTAATRTMTVAPIGMAAALTGLYVVGASAVAVIGALLVWGVFAFGIVPSFQYRVVSLAGPGGPLAASLPASAANLGIALGSTLGGVAVGAHGSAAGVLTAAVLAAVAVPAAAATGLLRPPTVESSEEMSTAAVERAPEPSYTG